MHGWQHVRYVRVQVCEMRQRGLMMCEHHPLLHHPLLHLHLHLHQTHAKRQVHDG